MNNKYSNIRRYVYGGLAGMITEYLFRVQFSIYALITLLALVSMFVIDIALNEK